MSKERSRHHDDPIHAPTEAHAAGTPGRIMRTALHRDAAPAGEASAASEPFEESHVLIAHDVPVVVQRFAFDLGALPTGGGGGGQPLPKSWHDDDEAKKQRRQERAKRRGFGPGRS